MCWVFFEYFKHLWYCLATKNIKVDPGVDGSCISSCVFWIYDMIMLWSSLNSWFAVILSHNLQSALTSFLKRPPSKWHNVDWSQFRTRSSGIFLLSLITDISRRKCRLCTNSLFERIPVLIEALRLTYPMRFRRESPSSSEIHMATISRSGVLSLAMTVPSAAAKTRVLLTGVYISAKRSRMYGLFLNVTTQIFFQRKWASFLFEWKWCYLTAVIPLCRCRNLLFI